MNPTTEARRRLVRRLLSDEPIHDQEQLRRVLTDHGYSVTQATVSRDLGAVGAVKIDDGNGGRYAIITGEGGGGDRGRAVSELRLALDQFMLTMAIAEPVIVVKVPPGAAHLVASRVDAAGLEGVLGTVAGDDTLLIVTATEVGASTVADRLTAGGR